MKTKRAFIAVLALFSLLFHSYGDTTDDKNSALSTDNIENLRDTLQYGIEEEVQSLIGTLHHEVSDEYMNYIYDRYKTATMDTTKIAIANYFTQCDKIAEPIVSTLYEDASSDLTNRQVKTTIFYTLAKHGGEKEHTLLIDKLSDPDKVIQNAASASLSKIKEPSIGKMILERLQKAKESDEYYLSTDITNNLILALAEIAYQDAVPYLQEILKDSASEKFSVMYSMYALAKIGDLSSLSYIQNKLSDDDAKVREYAGYALSAYKDPQMSAIYKEMLRHNDKKVRIYACQGIVKNNDTSAIDILLYKFNRDPEQEVKNEALKSLVLLGPTGITAIKKTLEGKKYNYTHYYVISDATSSSPTSENVSYTHELFKSADKNGKTIIAKNIVKSTSNLVDPIIKDLLTSDDYLLRIGGINSLLTIKDTTLTEDLKKIADSDPVPIVKKNATKVLAVIGTLK